MLRTVFILVFIFCLTACQSDAPLKSLSYKSVSQFVPFPQGYASHLEWSENGKWLLYSGVSNDIGTKKLDGSEGSHSHVLDEAAATSQIEVGIVAAHWTAKGNVFVALDNREVQVLSKDLSSRRFSYRFPEKTANRQFAYLSPNGRFVGFGNRVLDIRDHHLLPHPPASEEWPSGFVGNRFYLLDSRHCCDRVVLWKLHPHQIKHWDYDGVARAIPSHKGRWYLVWTRPSPCPCSGSDSHLRLYRAKDHALIGSTKANIAGQITVSPNDKWFAAVDSDHRIHIFGTDPFRQRFVTQPLSAVDNLVASGNILLASDGGKLAIWSVKEKKPEGMIEPSNIKGPENYMTAIAMSPDQQRLALAYPTGKVQILKLGLTPSQNH